MLAKAHRLTKEEFDRIYKVGKRLHCPIAQLIYAPSTHFHGAAVVGKKVYKKAVDRNTLRRRMYAILYSSCKEKDPHMTYILIAKPEITKKSRTEVRDAITKLLSSVPTT